MANVFLATLRYFCISVLKSMLMFSFSIVLAKYLK